MRSAGVWTKGVVLSLLIVVLFSLPRFHADVLRNWDSLELLRAANLGTPSPALEERLAAQAASNDCDFGASAYALNYLRYLTLMGDVNRAAKFARTAPCIDANGEPYLPEFASPALRATLLAQNAQAKAEIQDWPAAADDYRQVLSVDGKTLWDLFSLDYFQTLIGYYESDRSSPRSEVIAAVYSWKLGLLSDATTLLSSPLRSQDDQQRAIADAYYALIQADLVQGSHGSGATTSLPPSHNVRGNDLRFVPLEVLRTDPSVVVIDEWSAVSARDLDLAGKLLGGAILDPLLIGDDGPITTVLYWEVNGPSLQHQLEGTWRCDATTCMQVLSARNLVPDPGFEWKSSPPHHADSISKATSLVQATWKADLYPQADSAWFLTQARRSGFETTVSCLDNTAHTETAKVRTGITARISDVEPDALYLQIGWLETDGRSTNGLMGRMWLLPDSKQVWDYMVAGPQHTEWRSYGQIVRAAEDSTSGKLLLQNYNSGGKICFDDLIFIQLGR